MLYNIAVFYFIRSREFLIKQQEGQNEENQTKEFIMASGYSHGTVRTGTARGAEGKSSRDIL